MITAESFSSLVGELKTFYASSTDAYSWIFTMNTYNRLRYLNHLSKARLIEPRRKLRICHLRRMAQRRQAARRRYL